MFLIEKLPKEERSKYFDLFKSPFLDCDKSLYKDGDLYSYEYLIEEEETK